jgi:hypothetical protein
MRTTIWPMDPEEDPLDFDPDGQGLVRYWIEFDYGRPPAGISTWNPGPERCGVTAYDLDDAMRIVSADLFSGRSMPRIKSVVENVDISQLDQLAKVPYYAPPTWRGLWFPALRHSGPSVDDSTC